MISRSSLKLGHLGSKTRSPGQISRKPCSHSSGHIFQAIIMNLAQKVCLADFKVMYILLSSDFTNAYGSKLDLAVKGSNVNVRSSF